MKCVVTRDGLRAALTVAADVIPGKTGRPILQCARLEVSGDGLIVRATDLTHWVRHRCVIVSDAEPGTACVPGHKLAAISKEIAGDSVTLRLQKDRLIVQSQGQKFSLVVTDEAEYPADPESEAERATLAIAEQDLAAALGRVLPAAAREQVQYALNAVHLEAEGQTATFVTTDGRRLAAATCPATGAPEKAATALLSVPTAELARKLCTREGPTASVGISAQRVRIEAGNTVLIGRQVEGRFPSWRCILPQTKRAEMLPREALAAAVHAAAIMAPADGDTFGVRLELAGSRVTVRAASAAWGEAEVIVGDPAEGGAAEAVTFNPGYLLDFLRAANAEEVELALSGPDGPTQWSAGPGHVYVLMPIATTG